MKQRNRNAKTQTHEKPRPQPPAPTPEQIQLRAYEIYETRGGAPGREWEDWFLAEIELKAALGLRGDSAE